MEEILGEDPVEFSTAEQDHDFVVNGHQKGFIIGLQPFDAIFSVLKGQLTIITGIPSHGKSDFVDQMVVGYCKNYGFKTLFASFEHISVSQHKAALVGKLCGAFPTENNWETTAIQEAYKTANDHFFFFKQEAMEIDTILEVARQWVATGQIDVLVLDPYNLIRDNTKAKDVNEKTRDYLNKLLAFAKTTNTIVLQVAHPVKLYPHPTTNILPIPTFYNIKGGGEWYDMSHNGIAVYRDFKNEQVIVKVLKQKFGYLGQTDAECTLKWKEGVYVAAPKKKKTTESQQSNQFPTRDKQNTPR